MVQIASFKTPIAVKHQLISGSNKLVSKMTFLKIKSLPSIWYCVVEKQTYTTATIKLIAIDG